MPTIQDIQQCVQDSDEVREAIDQLVFALEYSHNKDSDAIAWETFQDRMKLAVMRARGYAQEMKEGA